MPDLRAIIQRYLEDDDVTGWFEDVYNATGAQGAPWSLHRPHPLLVSWIEQQPSPPPDARAIVTGCGEGDDAVYLAERGYTVTAFDVSEKAIAICNQRFPDSTVDFQVGDLFDLPAAWRGAFDLVVDNRTIQSLPPSRTEQAIHAVADLAAPHGGRVLAICFGRENDTSREGIPWPLSREDLQIFVEYGLREVEFDVVQRDPLRFRAVYETADDGH